MPRTIIFRTNFENDKTNKSNTTGLQYVIKEQQHTEFYKKKKIHIISENVQMEGTEGNAKI